MAAIWNMIVAAIQWLIDAFSSIFGTLWEAFAGFLEQAWLVILGWVDNLIYALKTMAVWLWEQLATVLEAGLTWAGVEPDAVRTGVKWFFDQAQAFNLYVPVVTLFNIWLAGIVIVMTVRGLKLARWISPI